MLSFRHRFLAWWLNCLCEISYHNRLAFLLVFPYLLTKLSVAWLYWAGSPFQISRWVIWTCWPVLGWLRWREFMQLPKSKMGAGVVYCYHSPCPFESFSWSILKGSKLFLFVPWSLYRSCQGHHELYLSPVFMKDQLLLRASNTCYSASMTPEPRLHKISP